MTHPGFGGPWTSEKLDILRDYLDVYTTALKKQPFKLWYIDPFAGSGWYSPRADYEESGQLQEGSASIALGITDKPFDRLIFVEKDKANYKSLRALKREYPYRDINIRRGDANDEVPRLCDAMSSSDRAVVFLDPYATEVDWAMVEAIAATQKIDCLILFPLMAVTRMMPRKREPDESWMRHLDRIFGGRERWSDFYSPSRQLGLFDAAPGLERRHRGGDDIVSAYKALLEGAFSSVASTRRALRNSTGSELFEFFFAAGNPKGASLAVRLAEHIVKRP